MQKFADLYKTTYMRIGRVFETNWLLTDSLLSAVSSCSSIDFTGPRSLHCLARADTRARAWCRVGGWLELRWAGGIGRNERRRRKRMKRRRRRR